MTLVFTDLETTGLADECDVWEIGLIVRKPGDPAEYGLDDDVNVTVDTEYSWLIRPDLTNAEPTGLRIGRYYQRIGVVGTWPIGDGKPIIHPDPEQKYIAATGRNIAFEVAGLLDGATIVGAVPDFDDRHLRRWLRANGQCLTSHYHLCDVETLAAGALRKPPPWNFDELLAAYGLTYDEADRHTALGDARLVRDLFDAVLGGREVAS